ncbi:MAG: TIGR02099 family protein [Alcanivoracaceae bacterium]|nr:TIGR02099 family protein [Alcanivoracaceae bacterium]
MADSTQSRNSRWRRVLPFLWWMVALVLLLMATYVVVARQLMLLVPDYRSTLETLFEERIQSPLEIAELEGHMDGLSPQFVVRKVRLPAPEGESPLELDEVVLSVDVLRSLLHRDLALESLRIDGVALNLVRDQDGRFRLRGLDTLSGSNRENPPLERILKLFYRQQLLSVTNARLSLEWQGMPPLAASSMEATLINDGDDHLLSVTLEARDRPLTIETRLHLHDDAYSLDEVNADLYLHVRGQRMQEWLPASVEWPVEIAALEGEVELWGSIADGQPESARLALSVPSLVLAQDDRQWPLEAVSLDLGLEREDEQATLSLGNVSAQSPAGQLLFGDVGLKWDTSGDSRQWQLRTGDLPVRAINQQFLKLPFALPDNLVRWQQQLQTLSPQGVVDGIYLKGHGRELERFQARFTALSSQADDRIPGVSRLSGWVSGSPNQGVVHLYSDNLSLTLPRLYGHPLMGQMTGVLGWEKHGDTLSLRSGRLRAVNADAHGEAMFASTIVPGEIPQLRLTADIYEGDGARASHYIPLKRLPDGLSQWLGQAIRGGSLRHGKLLYQGPVKIDKERQQDRTFQMRFQGRDVELSFLPDWPHATGIDADVRINGREVRGVARSGTLLNSKLSDVYVDVPPFETANGPRLVLFGNVDGPVTDLDTLFQTSPLKTILPDEMLDWRLLDGKMQGRLLLDFPFQKETGSPVVVVDATVQDGKVENAPRKLAFEQVQAPVYFHLRDGIQVPEFDARFMGNPVTGHWHTRGGRSQVAAQGTIKVPALRDWLGFPWLAPASGTLPVKLAVQVPWQGSRFSLKASSTLEGVEVKAPDPIGKGAGQTVPLSVEIETKGRAQQLALRYGDEIRGLFRLGDGLAGEVLLGGGHLQVPATGLNVRGTLRKGAVSPWLDFIGDQMAPALKQQGAGAGASSAGLLNNINVQIGELDLFGVAVPNAGLSVLPRDQGWDIALSSKAVAGSMHIPDGFSVRGEQPLSLTVSRLNLTLPDRAGQQQGAPFSPYQLPTLDARLNNLIINGEDFGEWQGSVRPISQGVRISDLDGLWRFTHIEGSLDWTAQGEGGDAAQYTRFNGSLSTGKLGRALQGWGLPEMIESEDARAKGVLGWSGWPLSPDYLAMEGQTRIDIGECRIPQTDTKTSFLRVLGILNIGTIQRRLRLDFSDLYKKGLSCDSITGDFRIDGPSVSTTNLAIKSPSAIIEAQGNVDLEKETLNHQMEVTLPLSSNLYAGCLAGPAACAGIFVVERIWGDKLDRTATMEYAVTGTWSDPKVKETEGMFE